ADVPLTRAWIAREDTGQGDVATAVAGPAMERRQPRQRGPRGLDHFLAGRRGDALGPGLHQVEQRVELAETLGEGAGQLQVEELRHALAELVQMAHAESGAHAVLRADCVVTLAQVDAL